MSIFLSTSTAIKLFFKSRGKESGLITPVRTDFNIFEQMQLSATEIEEFSFDIDKALLEFVELIDTQVSKKEILNKCLELYKISITQNE